MSCLDFIKRISRSGTMNVAPVPPNSPTSDMLKVREWAGVATGQQNLQVLGLVGKTDGGRCPGWTIEGPWRR